MDPSKTDASNKTDKQQLLDAYIASLSPLAKKGLEIAQDHLETSFSLEKSIGFMEFVKSQNK
jgi:hypothetical protein